MGNNLERAASLRALAGENRALARIISLRPDREALLKHAEELEAAAGRLEGMTPASSPCPSRVLATAETRRAQPPPVRSPRLLALFG
jgi:hypothetical protein